MEIEKDKNEYTAIMKKKKNIQRLSSSFNDVIMTSDNEQEEAEYINFTKSLKIKKIPPKKIQRREKGL